MRLEAHPHHPGRVFLDEFLRPMNCSRAEVALELGWSLRKLNLFIAGQESVDPDMADDLSRVLGTSRYVWLQLQARHSSYAATQRRGYLAAA